MSQGQGLTGNLAAWPLTDILNMLTNGSQTGRLVINREDAEAEIFLKDGAIVHATEGANTGEAAMVSVVAWNDGTFSFTPRAETAETTITRPAAQVLADCARIAAELAAIRAVIPGPEAVLTMTLDAPPAPVTLQPHEWQVLARLNGRASIRDVCNGLGRDEMTVTKVLYRLATNNMVKVETRPQPEPVAQQEQAFRMERPATPPPASSWQPPAAQPATGAPAAAQPAAAAPAASGSTLVGSSFFDALNAAAAEALGPMAQVIIEDELAAIGERKGSLTREKTAVLIDRIAGEIRELPMRGAFSQHMMAELKAQAAAGPSAGATDPNGALRTSRRVA